MKRVWFTVVLLLVFGILSGFWRGASTGLLVGNLPPVWDQATSEFSAGVAFDLDLNDAFFDPDGDSLSFSVSSDGAAVGVTDNRLVVLPRPGENSVWITASDGQVKVKHKILIYR